MNQFQIASRVVSGALRAANAAAGNPLDAETMIALSGTVSTAVSVHGEKNYKAIVKEAMKITPDFSLISEDFLLALAETPVIAEAVRAKNYEEISEFVIGNKDMSRKERFQLYADEYTPQSVKFWKGFRIVCLCITIICIIADICIYIFNPEIRKELTDKLTALKVSAKNIWKYIKKFLKAIKFVIHQITK